MFEHVFSAGVNEFHAQGSSSNVVTSNLRAAQRLDVIAVRPGASKHFRCVAMDSNKDEAERCIKIALIAVSNNQPDKARKFLEKAQRLFPTEQAKSTSNERVFRQ